MGRALAIAGCLIALLAPATASAGIATGGPNVTLPRGAVVVGYGGTAIATIPTSAYCQGTNPCIWYGDSTNRGEWHVTAVFTHDGPARAADTLLRASVEHSFLPDIGNPSDSPPAYPDCIVEVGNRNDRYLRGAFMTRTATSIGIQLSLPIDSQWMAPRNPTDPASCGWGGNYTGEGVFGAGSFGPTDPAQLRQLDLAGTPQLAARTSRRTTTKHFDFVYRGHPATGVDGNVFIRIVSSVTVITGCRRLYLPDHQCLGRYG